MISRHSPGEQLVEERQDHGVDRDRLARAGGAGDEQVRHAGEVGDHRLAADVLAEAQRQRGLGRSKSLAARISRRSTVSRSSLGSSMPMT